MLILIERKNHRNPHRIVFYLSNALLFSSSRPGRPPKRGPVGLSLPASHISSHHSQLKKHRLDDGDYSYENGHLSGEYFQKFDMKFLSRTLYFNVLKNRNEMECNQINHTFVHFFGALHCKQTITENERLWINVVKEK